MIKINSTVYGTLEVQEDQIYEFGTGILGLPDIKKYALFPMADTAFFVLHSVHDQISFLLLPAHGALDGYSFKVSDEVVAQLDLDSPEEAGVMLVVNIQEDQLYVNLMAPILISPHSMKGCQYIIKDQELSIRHPLVMAKGDS